ncbi:MAG TPA: hypothetical protein VNK95_02675 [Caldilineaceae bacterium]|nr:hypothetical protein [Caldilineaceae bacterium]
MRIKFWMISLLLVGALALLNACTASPAAPAAPVAEATEAVATEAVAEEPVAEPTEAPTEEPAPEATAAGVEEATDACPAPGEGTELVTNEAAGYCFLVPVGYTTEEPVAGQLTIFAPEGTEGHRERAFINVYAANGQSAAEAADAYETEMLGAAHDFPITRTTATLGGVEAVVLDNLPGQDINRQVIAVSHDQVYRLGFVPADPQMGEAYTQMEALYALVMSSFTFLPAEATTGAAGESAPVTGALLEWEGEIDGACMTLRILPDNSAEVGQCGDALQAADNVNQTEWAAIQSHFAGIEADTPAGRISLQGQGEASGPAWERAAATWARFTAMELSSGRAGASARTALAWMLGEVEGEPGTCRQLLILAYGLAYANRTPCEGGQTEQVAQGWLETSELETFQGWLDNSARIEDAAGYVDAQGSEPLDAETVTEWATLIYERLAEQ